MHILLEESITPAMLEQARILLIKFVCEFQDLFGAEYMHYNVHLLLHLTETVENWGPLWSESTFPFETQNKYLLQMKKCNYRIAQQIINRLLLTIQAPLLSNEDFISNKVKDFYLNLASNRLKKVSYVDTCVLRGAGKKFTPNEEESKCLSTLVDLSKVNEYVKYNRMIHNACRYTPIVHSKKRKNNDSNFSGKILS